MVLPLIGLAATVVLSFFAISAVATLAHWAAIAGSGIAAVALFRFLMMSGELEVLGFDDEVFEVLTAAVLSALTGFVLFKLSQALLASAGFGLAVAVIGLITASFVFGGGTVARVLVQVIGFVAELVGAVVGDN